MIGCTQCGGEKSAQRAQQQSLQEMKTKQQQSETRSFLSGGWPFLVNTQRQISFKSKRVADVAATWNALIGFLLRKEEEKKEQRRMGAAGRGVERVAYRESFQLIESRRSSFMPSRYPAIDPNSLVKKKRKGRG
jgi:hypothetical protein